MRTTRSFHGTRARWNLILLPVLVGILAFGPVDAVFAGGDRITVMTRNLYFGTDLGPVLSATSQTEFFLRVAAALDHARASDFPGRAKAWADEIEAARPDLIGLQEAVLWRTQTPANFSTTPNATTVEADLLALLLDELRGRGLRYDVVAIEEGYDVEAPGAFGSGLVDVRVTQREVILARRSASLKFQNVQGGQYAARLTLPTIIGVPVVIPWAWASVDVSYRGTSFRFATTHLDSNAGAIQEAQAAEFLAGPGSTDQPLIWLGDFNSDAEGQTISNVPPATATYGELMAAGFSDAWQEKHPDDSGFTCCQDPDLRNAVTGLDARIDLVLTRGPISVEEASIVGDESTDRLSSGLWPSDHAGVVVELELE